MKRLIIAASALLLTAATAVHAQTAPSSDNMRSAQYLAANCANCHGTQGRSAGAMPSLAGQSKVYLVEQMRAFRDGKRTATIMHQLAKGYTDQQIELMAEYFSRQSRSK